MDPLVSIVIPTYNKCEDTAKCVKSIYNSEYDNYEVIVVNNASTDNTKMTLMNLFGNKTNFMLLTLSRNMMAAGGRNVGIEHANGEYILFIDSDNIIEEKMITLLVQQMEKDKTIGLIGPSMFYYKDPKRIWFVSNSVNYITSKTTYKDTGKMIEGDLSGLVDTDHIPNVFMVRASCQKKIGYFDERYYIMYEEADFAARIRRKGYGIKVLLDAVTYHNCMTPEENTDNEMRKYGCDNALRTYHFSKNRSLYIKK